MMEKLTNAKVKRESKGEYFVAVETADGDECDCWFP